MTCEFAKEVGITMHQFYVPIYTRTLVKVDSIAGEFQIDMSLFTDAGMTEPMNEGHESKL